MRDDASRESGWVTLAELLGVLASSLGLVHGTAVLLIPGMASAVLLLAREAATENRSIGLQYGRAPGNRVPAGRNRSGNMDATTVGAVPREQGESYGATTPWPTDRFEEVAFLLASGEGLQKLQGTSGGTMDWRSKSTAISPPSATALALLGPRGLSLRISPRAILRAGSKCPLLLAPVLAPLDSARKAVDAAAREHKMPPVPAQCPIPPTMQQLCSLAAISGDPLASLVGRCLQAALAGGRVSRAKALAGAIWGEQQGHG